MGVRRDNNVGAPKEPEVPRRLTVSLKKAIPDGPGGKRSVGGFARDGGGVFSERLPAARRSDDRIDNATLEFVPHG